MNTLKTTFLLTALTLLLIFIGQALASALKKLHMGAARIPMDATPATAHMFIVNPLTGGGLMSLFSTHPPMEERVKRLEELSRQVL